MCIRVFISCCQLFFVCRHVMALQLNLQVYKLHTTAINIITYSYSLSELRVDRNTISHNTCVRYEPMNLQIKINGKDTAVLDERIYFHCRT